MKNILLILIVLLLSCNNKESTKENVNNKQTIPIFLSLSPEMDEIEFKNELVKLNESQELNNNRFEIKIKNKIIDFSVSKGHNDIALNYNQSNTYYDLDYKSSKEILEKLKNIKNDIIQIYDSKYKQINNTPLPLSTFPINGEIFNNFSNYESVDGVEMKNLSDYGFEKQYYNFFKDSIKTIAIGYNLIGEVAYSTEELKEMANKKSERKSSNALKNALKDTQRYAERELNGLDRNSTQKYSLELEIRYFSNSEFNKLSKQIINDSIRFDKAMQDYITRKKKDIEKTENNKNKI